MKAITFAASIGLTALVIGSNSCIYPVNPQYCEGHPTDYDKCPRPDAPNACTSNDQCAAPKAVCELSSGACVQCTTSEPSACSGGTPVCSANTCRACKAHNECPSNVCLPDGSCSAENVVAYVDAAGTSNTTCSRAMPCTKLTSALGTGRAYVKITGTIDEGATATIDNRDVTLLAAPGAKLARTSNGIVLEVKGTSHVTMYDLEISGGSGAQGIGISLPNGNTAMVDLHRAKVTGNAGGGISATGGTLNIMQSSVSGNAGGGVSITGGQFDISNTIITKNGSATTALGGVLLSQITTAGTHRFEFNTVSQNVATGGVTPGVLCSIVTMPLAFSSSIVFGNGSGTQVEGNNCAFTYSDIGPVAATGTGNINTDPQFANATQGDFHIGASSPCKDAADAAASLAIDVDGDTRPQGAARDIGADEVKQ